MKIIDLTHTISEAMPVYPGTEGPKLSGANTYEKDGFRETLLTLYSHTGTHMDAPAHIIDGKKTLDQMDVAHFVGRACVVDCTQVKAGERIELETILAQPLAPQAEFLLFYTEWDKNWGTEAYFGDYPYLSDEALNFIIDKKYKGIGLDVIGLDPIADSKLTLHNRLFKKSNCVVIENLKDLGMLGQEMFTFCALPLKFENADGAPIRAIAMID